MRVLRQKVRSQLVTMLGVVGFGALAVGIWNCGGPSSNDAAPETSTDPATGAPNSHKVDDPSAPQTLTIDTGGLKGATLDIPANALPAGATFALAEAASPAAFGTATSGENAPGSLALQVSFMDASGKAIDPTAPVTVSLPANAGSFALAPVEQVLANLFALLQTGDNGLFFWTHDMFVEVDKAAKVVKIKTLKGGVYQLAYLIALPANFTNAGTSGVTPATGAAPGGVDLAGVACPEGGTNQSAKFAANASFKTYLASLEKCFCELSPQSKQAGFACKGFLEQMLTPTVCVAPQSPAVDDAGWTKAFDSASDALKKYCDGTTFTPPATNTGTPTGADTGTGTAVQGAALSSGSPSCVETMGTCYAYRGSDYSAQLLMSVKNGCQSDGGTWSDAGGCPAASAVGVCKILVGQAGELWQVGYSPNQTAQASQQSCDGGVWSAP